MLKTQRPFVRKANVLKAVDFFSLLSLVILLLPGLIYRGMIMYNMIFVILVMGGEVMSFVLLGKNKFGLHSLLRFLGIGTIIVLNYLFNHSWLEYNLLEFENIAYYIPIFAINLWSMIVSFRKEIYMQ